MRSWEDESRLSEYVGAVAPLSGRMKDSLVAYATIPESYLESLEPLLDALNQLKNELEDREHTELRKTIVSFLCYTENLRAFPPRSSVAKQLELVYPIRTWIPTMPSKFLGLGTREVWVLVTIAYFNITLLATAMKHRIDTELHSIHGKNSDPEKSRDLQKAIALMRLPMLYVVDYRFRHCILKE